MIHRRVIDFLFKLKHLNKSEMTTLPLQLRIASYPVSLLLRLFRLTNRCQVIGFREYRQRLNRGEHVLIAFWHNQGLFMPFVWFGKPGRIKLIVSRSKDGDLIASLLLWFGIGNIRGSSSRGSTAALKELLRLDRKNTDSIVFTPDGPKGPIYKVKDGIGYLAISSKKPLYLQSVCCTKSKELHSWDRFRIPLPFGCATWVCSPGLYLSGHPGLTLDEAGRIIEDGLNFINRITEALSAGQITEKEARALLDPESLPWRPYSMAPAAS